MSEKRDDFINRQKSNCVYVYISFIRIVVRFVVFLLISLFNSRVVQELNKKKM